jgi:hypothetical protein
MRLAEFLWRHSPTKKTDLIADELDRLTASLEELEQTLKDKPKLRVVGQDAEQSKSDRPRIRD